MVIHNTNNFRTELHLKPSAIQVSFEHKLLTIGSCFSENIGEKLNQNKFSVAVNPFGTVYNPLSMFKLLGESELDESGFVEVGGQWYHLDFHSQFTGRDRQTLETLLKLKLQEVREFMRSVHTVFVTLGTSFVYEWKESGEIVANCHKIPQKQFSKRLLSIDEMKISFNQLKATLLAVNPLLQFIFTVSPVRHIKDGIAENQLSKSQLRVLCHELAQQGGVSYFPAYEMMMDDLRDYRFYKTDMIHPSEMAEDYIWEKFQQAHFSPSIQKILKEWSKIRAALNHRPFNPDSESHQLFLIELDKKLELFSEYFDIQQERALIKSQLIRE